MATAICVRCGSEKRRTLARCRHCGLDPRSNLVHHAHSVILSIDRFEDGTDRLKYAAELDRIAATLRSGEGVEYDPREVERLTESIKQGKRIPWWVGLKAFALVMLWLSPLWLIIALAIWLWLRR